MLNASLNKTFPSFLLTPKPFRNKDRVYLDDFRLLVLCLCAGDHSAGAYLPHRALHVHTLQRAAGHVQLLRAGRQGVLRAGLPRAVRAAVCILQGTHHRRTLYYGFSFLCWLNYKIFCGIPYDTIKYKIFCRIPDVVYLMIKNLICSCIADDMINYKIFCRIGDDRIKN